MCLAGVHITNGKEMAWSRVRVESLQGEVQEIEGIVHFAVMIFLRNKTESDFCAELDLEPEAKVRICSIT
jgi:hypothetical protein